MRFKGEGLEGAGGNLLVVSSLPLQWFRCVLPLMASLWWLRWCHLNDYARAIGEWD